MAGEVAPGWGSITWGVILKIWYFLLLVNWYWVHVLCTCWGVFTFAGEVLGHNVGNGEGIWRYGETLSHNGETWKHGETAEGIGGKHEEYGENGGTGEYGETDGEKCEKIGSHPYWTGKGFLPTF